MVGFVKAHSSTIRCNQRTWVFVKCSMMSITCGEEVNRRRGEHELCQKAPW